MLIDIVAENQRFTCPKLSAREKRKKYNSGLKRILTLCFGIKRVNK